MGEQQDFSRLELHSPKQFWGLFHLLVKRDQRQLRRALAKAMDDLDHAFKVEQVYDSLHVVVLIRSSTGPRYIFKGDISNFAFASHSFLRESQTLWAKLRKLVPILLGTERSRHGLANEIDFFLTHQDRLRGLMPRMLRHDPSKTWLLREHLEGEVMSQRANEPLDKPNARNLWHRYADLFDAIHHHEPPYLYIDSTRNNILLRHKDFYFFDFSEAQTLADAQMMPMTKVNENLKKRALPPEFYIARAKRDTRSDYYTFAALFAEGLLGEGPCDLVKTAHPMAHPKDKRNFDQRAAQTAAHMRRSKWEKADIDFILACLEVDIEKRPHAFARPSG